MADGADTPRYIVADWWGHIFDDRAGETGVRFVYDRTEERMLGVQFQRDQRWNEGGPDTVADVEDSLKNANPGAIENPAAWDLTATDELPDWYEAPSNPAP